MERPRSFPLKFVHKAGFILPVTISMLALMSVLVISLLKSLLMHAKTSAQMTHHHQSFYQLETAAFKLQKKSSAVFANNCLSKKSDVNAPLRLLFHNQGCKFIVHEKTYYFILQDLGLCPKGLLQGGENTQKSHHWLLTVMNEEKACLQLRLVEQGSTGSQAQRELNNILSWRYLKNCKL